MGKIVRPIEKSEYAILEEFLYNAIFLSPGTKLPPKEIIFEPNIFIYIKDFGGKDDTCVVAEQNGKIVGAAWARIIGAYGHVDNETPELAVSILPEFRGGGVGSNLMEKLFELLRSKGYKETSLSVQKENPAVRFYLRLGYKIINEKSSGDYIMIKEL